MQTMTSIYTRMILIALLLFPTYVAANSAYQGVTRSFSEVKLSCQVSGYIKQIPLKEGDRVKTGDLIIQLDDAEERLEAERRKLIWQSRASLKAAKNRESLLAKQVSTAHSLYSETGSISRDEYSKRQLEYQQAKGEREMLEESKEKEKIEYELAVVQHKKHAIHSPINGILTNVTLNPGELCELNYEIATIANPEKGLFVINIENTLGGNLKSDEKVIILLGEEKIRVEGKIIYISPVVDAASGLKTVKIEFDNANAHILPGVTGELVIDDGAVTPTGTSLIPDKTKTLQEP